MKKIVIAITGASGSIYAEGLLNKLLKAKEQWSELSVVMTDNAKEVWKTELQNDSHLLWLVHDGGAFGRHRRAQ